MPAAPAQRQFNKRAASGSFCSGRRPRPKAQRGEGGESAGGDTSSGSCCGDEDSSSSDAAARADEPGGGMEAASGGRPAAAAAAAAEAAAAASSDPPGSPALGEELRRKDEQIAALQHKLEHYRAWLSSLQGQVQNKDPQVIKNARRLYVGGIPEGTREDELRAFFDGVMASTGAACGPGSSIATCKISNDKSYAFLEMRSVEEASNAMAFDGIVFRDTNLKIRRPSNYSPADAIALGPTTPDPTINTSGLPMCKTVVEDSWNKIFIGGLPCHFSDDQVKELLAPYGALKSFNLVMDKTTGKSKGYAFCEFADPGVIPAVIHGLHMQCLERKVLTVKRALEGTRHGSSGQRYSAPPLGAGGKAALPPAAASGRGSSSSSSGGGPLQQQQQQQSQQQQQQPHGPGRPGGRARGGHASHSPPMLPSPPGSGEVTMPAVLAPSGFAGFAYLPGDPSAFGMPPGFGQAWAPGAFPGASAGSGSSSTGGGGAGGGKGHRQGGQFAGPPRGAPGGEGHAHAAGYAAAQQPPGGWPGSGSGQPRGGSSAAASKGGGSGAAGTGTYLGPGAPFGAAGSGGGAAAAAPTPSTPSPVPPTPPGTTPPALDAPQGSSEGGVGSPPQQHSPPPQQTQPQQQLQQQQQAQQPAGQPDSSAS